VDTWGWWLAPEAEVIQQDVAFGIIGSTATLTSRVFLLKHWWLPGAVGCLCVALTTTPATPKYKYTPVRPVYYKPCPPPYPCKPFYTSMLRL